MSERDALRDVFLSNVKKEVFHSVEHRHQIWRENPFDVESVHEHARAEFQRLLVQVTTPPGLSSGRLLLLLGESGSGKTHLVRAFRNYAHVNGLGFVGYMRPWHRLELVLEAMARPGNERLHLVMVGEGPALPDLLERAAALSVGDRVHALGAVPGEDVPAACLAFDVALIPAINDYASPLKLFDSLAAGVATVALDQAMTGARGGK